MTVGIGCICGQKSKPGAIALGLDTRMTYVAGTAVVGKHDQTSKLFSLPLGFLGIVAGTFYQCERFISYLYDRMEETAKAVSEVQLDHAVNAMTYANHQVRLRLFENELVSKMGLTRMEWLDKKLSDPKLRRTGRWLARQIVPDVYSIVAGFLRNRPVLLRVCGKDAVEEEQSHTVIGSGGVFALKKLAFRGQNPYSSIQRTGLAISEALRFARTKDKFVGPPAFGVLVLPDKVGKQFDPTATLLRTWSKGTRKAETPNLDAPERWKEFEKLLIPLTITSGPHP